MYLVANPPHRLAVSLEPALELADGDELPAAAAHDSDLRRDVLRPEVPRDAHRRARLLDVQRHIAPWPTRPTANSRSYRTDDTRPSSTRFLAGHNPSDSAGSAGSRRRKRLYRA